MVDRLVNANVLSCLNESDAQNCSASRSLSCEDGDMEINQFVADIGGFKGTKNGHQQGIANGLDEVIEWRGLGHLAGGKDQVI